MRRTLVLLAAILTLAILNPGLLGAAQPASEPAPASQEEGAAATAEGGELTDSGLAEEQAGTVPEPEGHADDAGGHSEGDGHGEGEGHGGPVVPVLFGVAIILAVAKLGGEVFERIGQPAVLGELVFGVLLGNLTLVGVNYFEFLGTNLGIEILAQIGVILLLFDVGLESNVQEMLSVGVSSLLVAVLGIVAPFFLGWAASAYFLPNEELLVHLFIGATLCATSVGITARVLTDLGKISARESKIILGAAVIDDILGLVILAVVTGIISAANTGGDLASMDVVMIIIKAVIFLGGAIVIGGWLSPRMFKLASRLRIKGMLLTTSLIFLFVLSWAADQIGLATIVGAFAAGLILDEVHYKDFIDRGAHTLEEVIHPLTVFLVPIFFVLMGIRVDLSSFGQASILGFAAALSIVAIIGKMICALGVVEKGLDRISVAVGMVPRGEVGLIFASIGAALVLHGQPVISGEIFAAVVIMVIVTTLITPPALKYTLDRGDRAKAARGEAVEVDGGQEPKRRGHTDPPGPVE